MSRNNAFVSPKRKKRNPFFLILLCFGFLAIPSCVVNPVTGKRELGIVTQDQEIAIGREQYRGTQQTQGGLYRVDRDVADYVRRVGHRIARTSGVALPYQFVVVNNSSPNAWALPGGKIAVNRGLLIELHSEAELAAVLAHEIAHAAARHGARRIERGMLLQGGLLVASIASRKSTNGRLVVGGAEVGMQLIQQKYSRDAEFEADRYGMQFMSLAGYDPGAAVDLQVTFVRLAKDRKIDWMSGLFSTHPPSTDRVKRNREQLEVMRTGSVLGREVGVQEYREAIGYLRQMTPAYRKFDEAQRIFSAGNTGKAAKKINEAIEIEDGDATFYTFSGDIRYRQERFTDSLKEYDRALAIDPEHFAIFLGRGLTHIQLNEPLLAKVDLERSVELLPTAIAFYELGKIFEIDGQFETALKHYQQAAASESVSGQQAKKAAFRLGLARRPEDFISVQIEGVFPQILIKITNLTEFNLYNVVLDVAVIEPGLKTRRDQIEVLRLDQTSTVKRMLEIENAVGGKNLKASVVSASVQPI